VFEDVARITFELSNRCPLQGEHKLCPVHTFKQVHILPLNTIKKIIEELKGMGWGNGKKVAFHAFNEPLIDPRLYWLIGFITQELPGIQPLLITNGWYLNRTLAGELFDVGLSSLVVSGYSRAERKRLRSVGRMKAARVGRAQLKQSILYPGDGPDSYRDCFAPLNDLTIRASGNVGLCCVDYAETVTFGNVNEEALGSIMQREYPRMKALQDDLRKRVRTLPVCKTCHRRRKKF